MDVSNGVVYVQYFIVLFYHCFSFRLFILVDFSVSPLSSQCVFLKLFYIFILIETTGSIWSKLCRNGPNVNHILNCFWLVRIQCAIAKKRNIFKLWITSYSLKPWLSEIVSVVYKSSSFWETKTSLVKHKMITKLTVQHKLPMNKGNNKTTELRTIIQRESQNS